MNSFVVVFGGFGKCGLVCASATVCVRDCRSGGPGEGAGVRAGFPGGGGAADPRRRGREGTPPPKAQWANTNETHAQQLYFPHIIS